MIQVRIIYKLSNGWIVEYEDVKYILNDWDIIYIDHKPYTYPNKLVQKYIPVV